MGVFDNKFLNLLMLLFVVVIIVQIMSFLDIDYVFFLGYLLWFIAIGLFMIFLPRSHDSVF